MKREIRGPLVFLISLILIWFSFLIFGKEESLNILLKMDLLSAALSVVIAFCLLFISGNQYAIVLNQVNIKFEFEERVLFPPTMALWGILIPFQGALLFSTLYFKSKFNNSIGTGLSISLFLYAITICLTGLIGLVFVIGSARIEPPLLAFLIMITIAPMLIPVLHGPLVKMSAQFKSPSGLAGRLLKFSLSVGESVTSMTRTPSLLVKVAGIKVFKTVLVGFWYSVIAQGLGLDIGFVPLVLLSLVAELALVVKITPGNLGVNQLLSGVTMSFMDFNPEWGVLISLVASGSALVLVFTLGSYGNFRFMRDYGFESFSELWAKMKS